MVLSSVPILLAFVYAGIMFAYRYQWQFIPIWTIPADFKPTVFVTVVVPVRDESQNILSCLKSITNGHYPAELLEILVVDDFSRDDTVAVVQQFVRENPAPSVIQLIELASLLPSEFRETANKKKAIETAVARARGEIIVTTDGDCIAQPDWLPLLVSKFGSESRLQILTGPVVFHREKNVLQRFQSLDFLGLMGITGAGIASGWHHMGNGANLAYRKSAFFEAGGYTGNERVPSGDDMFLIQKMAVKWPGCVGFLKNPAATVYTEAKETWPAFWQQRLRWGTKNAALPELGIRLVLLMVWMFCSSIVVALVLSLCQWMPWYILVFMLMLKGISDWVFLRTMCVFFNRPALMQSFPVAFFIHILYICMTGLASLVSGQYQWKGRVVSAKSSGLN